MNRKKMQERRNKDGRRKVREVKPMRGGRGAVRGPMPKVDNPGQILKRLMKYVFSNYKLHFAAVIVCILLSTLMTLRGTWFMQSLIDDYIIPLTKAEVPDFEPLAKALGSLAVTYGIGIAAGYIYNRIMVNISQGTMKKLRVDIFTHMESLPIKYFDTHVHGDIMSVYTNDVDTLRQLIGQSIPQLVNSLVTVVSTFVMMIVLDIPLTIITVLMVVVSMFAATKLAKRWKLLCKTTKRFGKRKRLYRRNAARAEGR